MQICRFVVAYVVGYYLCRRGVELTYIYENLWGVVLFGVCFCASLLVLYWGMLGMF